MNTSTGRILIVDDEAAHLVALCNTLGDHGYVTVGLTSSSEALDMLRHSQFDILLTDLQMPVMDGISLLRAALDIRPELVGVLMTGHGSVGTAVEAMKVGALDYILKPFKLSAALPVLARAVEIKRLRGENAALEKSLRDHAAELEAVNADLEAFSRTVAHDLRNPLSIISGYSKLLKTISSNKLSPDELQLVDKIFEGTKQMDTLIRELLRFARLGRHPLAKQPLDIRGIAGEVLKELQTQHSDRTIACRVDDLPVCVGDRPLIRQVFVNLLSNAFKFTRTKEAATVWVGYERRGADVVYFVKDNGVGFDATSAKRLFDVFQRFHREDQFEGTGIGLSVVQRIIQRHGGRVWAEAQVGQGASFFFSLPSPSTT